MLLFFPSVYRFRFLLTHKRQKSWIACTQCVCVGVCWKKCAHRYSIIINYINAANNMVNKNCAFFLFVRLFFVFAIHCYAHKMNEWRQARPNGKNHIVWLLWVFCLSLSFSFTVFIFWTNMPQLMLSNRWSSVEMISFRIDFWHCWCCFLSTWFSWLHK